MAGSRIRTRYCSIEFPGFDIHVQSLWDRQQFSDDEHVARDLGVSSSEWPLFGILWPSGRVLARIMASRPVTGLRILEVGCGLGLSSLVLNHRGADITATDLHPEAEGFLEANTALNGDPQVPFVRMGWSERDPELGRFDLIVGSDVIYDRHQVSVLAAFLRRHCADGGEVTIVDPGRRERGRFRRHMADEGFSGREHLASLEERAGVCEVAHVMTFGLPSD